MLANPSKKTVQSQRENFALYILRCNGYFFATFDKSHKVRNTSTTLIFPFFPFVDVIFDLGIDKDSPIIEKFTHLTSISRLKIHNENSLKDRALISRQPHESGRFSRLYHISCKTRHLAEVCYFITSCCQNRVRNFKNVHVYP